MKVAEVILVGGILKVKLEEQNTSNNAKVFTLAKFLEFRDQVVKLKWMEVQALLLREGREVGMDANFNNRSKIIVIYDIVHRPKVEINELETKINNEWIRS